MTETERILARCLGALDKGETVEESLARYPDKRDELEPLLHAAQITRTTPSVVPSPDFREGARDRMVSMIREKESETARHHTTRRRGFLKWLFPHAGVSGPVRRSALAATAALTALLVVTAASVGVVHASSDTLPGDSLYPVKLAAERLRMAISLTQNEELRLRLQFASERLEEANELAARNRGEEIEPLMRQYAAELEAANGILRRQRDRDSEATSVYRLIRHQLDQQQAQLMAIQDLVSDEARPAVEHALAASEDTKRQAMEFEDSPKATPSVSPWPSPTTSPAHGPSLTPSPKADVGPRDEAPTYTPSIPGRTRTPESPGLTATPNPPGLTRTRMPARPTGTAVDPKTGDTPPPPGLTRTPKGFERTRTPGPPEPRSTPRPPDADPQEPGDTPGAPEFGPPGLESTPGPPNPDPPGQGEGPDPPASDSPGEDNSPNPPGNPDHSDPEDSGRPTDPTDPGPPGQGESPDQP